MESPTHIHIHVPNIYVGGIEQWALSLIKNLPELRWTVSTPTGAISHPVGVDNFRDITVVDEASIPHDTDCILACAPIRTLPSNTRTVLVAHGTAPYYQGIANNTKYTDGVAVSKIARQAFPNSIKATVIYNGIDVQRLNVTKPAAQVRRDLNISPDAIVIGYVGRWSLEKNPLAAAEAAAMFPNAVALYVGTGPGYLDWERRAQLIADCRFVQPEQVDSIGNFYAVCDVCVFASHSEGFCLSIAEAWYARVPVVATRVGVAVEHPKYITEIPHRPSPAELKAGVDQALSTRSSQGISDAHAAILAFYNSQRMANDWRSYLHSLQNDPYRPNTELQAR